MCNPAVITTQLLKTHTYAHCLCGITSSVCECAESPLRQHRVGWAVWVKDILSSLAEMRQQLQNNSTNRKNKCFPLCELHEVSKKGNHCALADTLDTYSTNLNAWLISTHTHTHGWTVLKWRLLLSKHSEILHFYAFLIKSECYCSDALRKSWSSKWVALLFEQLMYQ